jgi:hypothetical protein
MMTSVQDQLIDEIARDVVSQIAPDELPIFQVVSKAYFKNPEKAIKNFKASDDLLGFGLGSEIVALTPVILVASSEVIKFLWELFKDVGKDLIAEKIEGMLNGTPPSNVPALKSEHLPQIREIVLQTTKRCDIPEKTATLIADAVVGQFAVSDKQTEDT